MGIQHIVQITTVFLTLGVGLALARAPVPKEGPSDEEREVKVPKPLQDEKGLMVHLLAYSPKHKLLASAPGIYYFGQFGKPALPVYIWDLSSGERKRVLVGHGQEIQNLTFLPEGDRLLSGAIDGMVLWDPLKGTENREHFKALSGPARLTPSGRELFNWNEQADVAIWDAQSVQKRRVLKATDETRKGIEGVDYLSSALSSDERFLALGAGLMNHRIVVWDYKNGKVAATLDHETRLFNLSFSKSGRYLFAGGNERRKGHLGRGVLDIWDTASWKLIREIEVDEYEINPILYIPKYDLVLSVELLRPPDVGRRSLFKTLINGYSIKTGERLVSYDTQLATNDCRTASIYLEEFNAICIGTAKGKISFFSVAEILKQKK